jgi:phosphatidyl-myo-inositol dimannoside synthase
LGLGPSEWCIQICFLMTPVLFLSLTCFSRSGGIESYNKNWTFALQQLSQSKAFPFCHLSLHDDIADNRYVGPGFFLGCKGNKFKFISHLFKQWKPGTTLVIGHLHLAFPVWLIAHVKLLPLNKKKLSFLVPLHGIEVWKPLSFAQTWLCQRAEKLMPVSHYTWQQFIQHNPRFSSFQFFTLSNALDPFFLCPQKFEKPVKLLERYGLSPKGPILLTLARFSFEEQYKGYDQVIAALPLLKKTHPNIIYLLAGKADAAEKARVNELIQAHQVQQQVKWLGWVKSEELIDHFLLADAFVMPGSNEGFGIAYIEATACGTPTLGSVLDGSKEALLKGKNGWLVDAQNPSDLIAAIIDMLTANEQEKSKRQTLTLDHFSFQNFIQNIDHLIGGAKRQ